MGMPRRMGLRACPEVVDSQCSEIHRPRQGDSRHRIRRLTSCAFGSPTRVAASTLIGWVSCVSPLFRATCRPRSSTRASVWGLPWSDLCLHALGGKLEFSANEPQGTDGQLRYSPSALATPPAEAGQSSTPVDGEPTTLPVLVVEDNPLNSKVIERILGRSGYDCQLTENGAEALQAISQNSYCCVLMDCQMPVMDGYEATRRIRQMEEDTGEHIPIIAVTANALADDRDLCLQAGMDDYLRKPVRKQELVVALEGYVGKPGPAGVAPASGS